MFLWGNSDGHQKLHLTSWESVSIPVEYRGWNIKHLEWFGISLRLKNLWLLLNGNGIWSRIISHKYLKHKPWEVWIRDRKFNASGTSYFWNGFLRVLYWITNHLGWKVGNNQKIRLGIDPIASMNLSFLLSKDLRGYLADYGITYLA